MMDEYVSKRAVDSWFSIRWKALAAVLGAFGGVAVIAASVLELVRAAA